MRNDFLSIISGLRPFINQMERSYSPASLGENILFQYQFKKTKKSLAEMPFQYISVTDKRSIIFLFLNGKTILQRIKPSLQYCKPNNYYLIGAGTKGRNGTINGQPKRSVIAYDNVMFVETIREIPKICLFAYETVRNDAKSGMTVCPPYPLSVYPKMAQNVYEKHGNSSATKTQVLIKQEFVRGSTGCSNSNAYTCNFLRMV
ncbi:hypothetical protein DVR12_18160 [Chitinophaga silvatica]|uniref:Uncharacterized protein n=1 Tax=Chitinophaga silvatica TaxID=2282649 RepID=A0A3E1Y6W4_9BACT|nr:hypothetical protein [Chitinophaga silvatica]RFS20493.1 hypothetical protein DVR12_18160 [Chitinophaga silvatica]